MAYKVLAQGSTWERSMIQSIEFYDPFNPLFPSGGTFTLSLNGETTAPIAFDASAVDVRNAIASALTSLGGSGNLFVSSHGGSIFGWDVYFVGTLQGTNPDPLGIDDTNMTMTTTNDDGSTSTDHFSMTINVKQNGGVIETRLYTAPTGMQTVVSTLTICNTGDADALYSVGVATSGGGVSYLMWNAPLAVNESKFLTLGLTFGSAEGITYNASVGNVTFIAFGDESAVPAAPAGPGF